MAVSCLGYCAHKLFIFWALLLGSYGSLPDYSKEYFTEDALELSMHPERVKYLQDNYENKPLFCRADICVADNTSDVHKGWFRWPVTQVGTVVQLRCPYAINSYVYASRYCRLIDLTENNLHPFGLNETQGIWSDPVISQCPDPPLTELLRTLTGTDPPQIDSVTWYTDVLRQINFTLVTYPEPFIFTEDVVTMATLVTHSSQAALSRRTAFPTETLRQAFEILDKIFLIDSMRNGILSYFLGKDGGNRLLQSMLILCEMWMPDKGEMESTFVGKYLTIKAGVPHQNNTYMFDRAEWNKYEHWYMPTTVDVVGIFNEDSVLHFLYLTHYRFIVTTLMDLSSSATSVLEERHSEPIKAPVTSSSGRIKRQLTPFRPYESLRPISAIVYVSMSRRHVQGRGQFEMWENLRDAAPVDIRLNSSYNPNIHSLRFPPVCGGISIKEDFQYNITRFHGRDWRDMPCVLWQNVVQGMSSRCVCSGYGLYTVFADPMTTDSSIVGPTMIPLPPQEGTTFSEFLGFPYNYELYIVGHVFRALSLVCLIITVLSYLIFRKARHGTPTKILLHLCITLILLIIVLYVADQVAGSKWGCRMSNILRYYLVMVSLLWNATEAFNMYLMLIKVFKSHVSKFVLKAALVSWGLPLVPIIIVLAINHEGFDGYYTLHNCKFRCSMQDYVFYFAYLLPMGCIVFTNIVVFVLVVKVLVRNSSTAPGKIPAEEKRSQSVVRLVGSISMLVLLGIPWVFSAFGAIDDTAGNTSLSMLSGVFQVVTVVFINLQGVFIFLFHCVRNPDMRTQWRESLTSSSASYSGNTQSGRSKGIFTSSISTERNYSNKAIDKSDTAETKEAESEN